MVLYQRGILSLGSEVLRSDTGVLTRTCGSKTFAITPGCDCCS